MLKIAITGLTGFVGTNLKKYLSSYDIEPLGVRYLPNQKIEIKSDVIIHLAGKAHDLKKVSKPNDYYDANYELTKQLFDAFLESDAAVFIFMSTVKAVADKVDEILTEKTISDPKTHYGIAKQQAEEYILGKGLPEGKRVYILRPCMIHGPENKGNLNLLYKLVAKGLPWPLGAFQNQRSFLSVENLCFLIQKLIENEKIVSGVYNCADDEVLSTNEVVQIISLVLNKKNRSVAIRKSIINGIAKIGDIIRFPLNTETVQKLTENYMVSNHKIKKALEIEKLPYTAQEGLEKTIKSFINK
ncbi:NAD-dependent epimerase/dehydratase family protein [Flavobacterium sp. Fl-77]|uniref:NAD-dependent epimerase/dehydratase family protein n=1 Tax=Flavobacterium flavipigmentatum TaxID=2893884 RepID=A0AAJ2SF11_9FLAO|nr:MULTISPECIES: NAD-dependent epimerase/dehydratase family protein [unclassified Flavobacterium]MDX6182217.1 NAD-dependent epimerase/dehydratase family protein [Flavobacterium sp. Fl-33]MDX6185870.1 NAD-dependent epimerase/dehydratase family protein [Flavobacterium sp. Fl-77]UFH39048.1 NAD-dependent epimerase/dehydratase family protein [Flavobacterium sp. F-70]